MLYIGIYIGMFITDRIKNDSHKKYLRPRVKW